MYMFMQKYQVYILIAAGVISLMLSMFAMTIKFHSIRKKKALIKLEVGVFVLLISNALSRSYDGNTTAFGFAITRITNFLLFALILVNLYFLCEYMTSIYMGTGKFHKLPTRLLLGFILPWPGITLVAIAQFCEVFYYFDESNHYMRGPMYLLMYVFPIVTSIVLLSFAHRNAQMVSGKLLVSLTLFIILPVAGGIAQIFLSSISLLNICTFISATFLFWTTLLDQNDELTAAANTEVATGLPNTYGYLYEVEKVINYQDITAYNGYYFDIVRMSQLNNKYGKELGDEIIARYASYIRDFIDDDEILGRLGGNYFVALIKKSNTYKFLNMLSDVPVDITVNGQVKNLHIAAVAGGYEVKNKNIAAGQILGNTSAAVNYAKNVLHKPYVFLDEKLEEEFKRVRQQEENIRKALAAGEFVPFYQPKVETEGDSLCGAEALARWVHEDRIVPPVEFIPIMEKNSSICELDMYILDYVCRDIRQWIDMNMHPLTVSVNISRRNFSNPMLAMDIYNIIKKYDVPEDLIRIEITETLDEYPLSVLKEFVESLHSYGIKVAIDDFGTGSSSLLLLKDVNFDILKIDRSFMDFSDKKGKLLLADIIHLAKDMKIAVIAEGVESPEHVKELSEMGCSMIQGFIFDRPLEKSEFEKRLTNPHYTMNI